MCPLLECASPHRSLLSNGDDDDDDDNDDDDVDAEVMWMRYMCASGVYARVVSMSVHEMRISPSACRAEVYIYYCPLCGMLT